MFYTINCVFRFMPPDDPLGRHGPSLENFLRKRPVIPEHRKQPCPYGKNLHHTSSCKVEKFSNSQIISVSL